MLFSIGWENSLLLSNPIGQSQKYITLELKSRLFSSVAEKKKSCNVELKTNTKVSVIPNYTLGCVAVGTSCLECVEPLDTTCYLVWLVAANHSATPEPTAQRGYTVLLSDFGIKYEKKKKIIVACDHLKLEAVIYLTVFSEILQGTDTDARKNANRRMRGREASPSEFFFSTQLSRFITLRYLLALLNHIEYAGLLAHIRSCGENCCPGLFSEEVAQCVKALY